MRAGIGHNNGPSMEPGFTYRRGLWQKARKELIPKTLPIEVIRGRVRRAKELGLPYKTYASIRASSGRDVIGLLFSDNALRVRRARLRMAHDRFEKLSQVSGCSLSAAVHAPLNPEEVIEANPILTFAGVAPGITATWPETATMLRAAVSPAGMPFDGVIIVGETGLEREWCAALKAAFFLPAQRYFDPTS
ncbi:MAG: hypothetical protein QNI90_05770 [Dinoroseobacter sp.]|nr:hypothetical protein [Dinoroseobacter sp.]